MFHSPFCETHEVNVEPAKVPAIDIAGKMPLAGSIDPVRSACLESATQIRDWNIRGWATWRSQGTCRYNPYGTPGR
ncbi:MAG TPA: hypothetical protein VHJ58_08980 [Vicinamibacterales bacterium]|jgi:hypothetical protein|nr:hypothetical protein [Vicinamibacterales bacterium]